MASVVTRRDKLSRYAKIAGQTLRRQILGVNKSLDLRHITFEVTNLCNSKCEMCHIWANKPSENILTTEDIRRIFADPGFANLEDAILTGGEMFMRDDIPEIVEIIWKINGRTSITCSTNGILGDKIVATAEVIAKRGVPVTYGISLDGLGEAHEKRRRAPGNFEAIDQVLLPGLKKLREQYPDLVNINLAHCLDQYGLVTFEDVRDYAKAQDVGFMTQLIEDFDYYLPELKRSRKTEGWDNLLDTKKGIDGKNRLMKKEIYSSNNRRYTDYIREFRPTVHHFRLLNVLEGADTRYECSSLRNFFLIRYDGKVAPCLRFADWEAGDLKKQSISDLSKSQTHKEAVNSVLKCDGCLNTWCTDWSMEKNALPFHREVGKWFRAKFLKAQHA